MTRSEICSSLRYVRWYAVPVAIDKTAVNVNGYLVSLQQLYGIDVNRRAVLVSEDNGLSWQTTSTQRLTWAAGQGADYIPAVPVPWVQGSGLTSAAPVAPYVVASWGGMRYITLRLLLRFVRQNYTVVKWLNNYLQRQTQTISERTQALTNKRHNIPHSDRRISQTTD